MTDHTDKKIVYRFGGFRLDRHAGLLYFREREISLRRKLFETLVTLIENRGRVIDKNELLDTIWKDAFVTEASLARNISELRKILAAFDDSVQAIETIPGRGYRFTIPLEEPSEPAVEPAPPRSDTRTIAVMPFRTIRNRPTTDKLALDEVLRFGMADALIAKLSAVRKIVVRPTSAVRRFMNEDWSVTDIRTDLNVDTLLEGTIQIVDEKIRVSVQLIDVADRRPLWAGTFDDVLDDIFSIQDSISTRVANALLSELTPAEETALQKRYTNRADAHLAYLKGRYHAEKRTAEEVNLAIEYFQNAIDLDPSYTPALSAMAMCYTHLCSYQYALSPTEGMTTGKALIRQALMLDTDFPDTYTVLGLITTRYDRQWHDAEGLFQHALRLNPNSAHAHFWYGQLLIFRGRLDEAVATLETARGLDPTSPSVGANLGWALYLNGEPDRALDILEADFRRERFFFTAHMLRRIYGRLGAREKTLEMGRLAFDLGGHSLVARLWLAQMHGHLGNEATVREQLAPIVADARSAYLSSYETALAFAMIDDRDQALHWLERAETSRHLNVPFTAIEPEFRRLRDEPRFIELVERLNLDDALAVALP